MFKKILFFLYNLDIEYPKFLTGILYNERKVRHLIWSNLLRVFYYQPIFRARCAKIGKNLRLMSALPYFSGKMEIIIGDNFTLHGLSNLEARTDVYDWTPKLIIGDNVTIGHRNVISVGKLISIGNNVLIAPEVRMRDNDGHPLDPKKRSANIPIEPQNIKPITIEDDVWIGVFSLITKGVTIGKGAVIGAGSVVTRDIPPYCVAAGNPARVIKKLDVAGDIDKREG